MTEPCDCNERTGASCFYHKLHTIQFSGRGRSPQSMMEARWERDMPAYQRLRRNGLQPPKIDGCAALERDAHSQMEVELGHLVDKKILPQISEGMAVARDLDWTPHDSVDAVKQKSGIRG